MLLEVCGGSRPTHTLSRWALAWLVWGKTWRVELFSLDGSSALPADVFSSSHGPDGLGFYKAQDLLHVIYLCIY